MKTIQIIMDDETHTEFKRVCASEHGYMRNKAHELIVEYIKNVKASRQAIKELKQ